MSRPQELDRPRARGHVSGDHVEQRRFPGPVRAENRAALARRDVEVDVPHGVEAAEAPADPPKTEDRRDAVGLLVCSQYRPYPPTVGTVSSLPCHGRLRFVQVGKFRPGAGVDELNVPPNVWLTLGIAAIVLIASLPLFRYSCW